MAYDAALAAEIRERLAGITGVYEQRMFGGLAFLVGGHMAVSASGQGGLLLRVDPAATEKLTDPPNVTRFVMRGRELDGWLRVQPEAVADPEELARWVDIGVRYAGSLPPK
jgi:hypothetical protein